MCKTNPTKIYNKQFIKSTCRQPKLKLKCMYVCVYVKNKKKTFYHTKVKSCIYAQ